MGSPRFSTICDAPRRNTCRSCPKQQGRYGGQQVTDTRRLCERQPVGLDSLCLGRWVPISISADNIAGHEPNQVIDLSEIEAQSAGDLHS